MIEKPDLFIMRLYFLIFAILFLNQVILCAQSKKNTSKDQNNIVPVVMNFWNEEVYQINTIPLAKDHSATWIYMDPVTHRGSSKSPTNAAEVITHFYDQVEARRARGIFIFSNYYASPASGLTSFQFMLYHEKYWRDSEKALIEDLQATCEAQQIPLYINTDPSYTKPWRILVAPKPPNKKP